MKFTALGISALVAALSVAACEKNNNPPTTTAPRTTPSTSDYRPSPSSPDTTRPRTPDTATGTNRPAPDKDTDNTAQNKRDRDTANQTPMDQGESKEAIRITADIRKAVLDDKNLSTNAHNCKIITDNSGVVTLRGTVDSQAEKDQIEAKAKAIAGVSRVDNQLEVKGG